MTVKVAVLVNLFCVCVRLAVSLGGAVTDLANASPLFCLNSVAPLLNAAMAGTGRNYLADTGRRIHCVSVVWNVV